MSGCCFNQVESHSGTDLQLVERPLIHMGLITGFRENQSGTIVFPLSQLLNWNMFPFCVYLTQTPNRTNDMCFQTLEIQGMLELIEFKCKIIKWNTIL